jgi:hypothetical protein
MEQQKCRTTVIPEQIEDERKQLLACHVDFPGYVIGKGALESFGNISELRQLSSGNSR